MDVQDARDLRECRHEDSRDLTASQVASDEDEYPSPAGSQCRDLQVALEVIVVDFNGESLRDKGAADWLNAE